jgi:cyclic pyranopterin phosphate synthase
MTEILMYEWRFRFIGYWEIGIYLEFGIWLLEFNLPLVIGKRRSKMSKLTHFDKRGRAKMVDVSKKAETLREAVVRGSVFMKPQTFKKIMSGSIVKGDVFAVAKVAGIMAAKKTSEIIPMCHPINLSHVEVNFFPFQKESRIDIEAKVKIKAQTGVEMEGFVAVAVAGLTIYDMCKAIDRGMVISDIHLVKKTGGKSGTYSSKNLPSLGGRG